MKLTRKQAIEILTTDEVYQVLNLGAFYNPENEACPSIYEVLAALGVNHEEIEEVIGEY